jgi:ribosomal protein S10
MQEYNNEVFSSIIEIIERRTKELKKYAQLPNAKESVISIRNFEIKELYDLASKVESIRNFETWEWLEKRLFELQNSDPNLSGHIVKIKVNNNTPNYSMTTINLTSTHE